MLVFSDVLFPCILPCVSSSSLERFAKLHELISIISCFMLKVLLSLPNS